VRRGQMVKEVRPAKQGLPGESVLAEEEAKGAGPCKEGGSSFEVEGSGVKTYACNGESAAGGAGGLPKTLGTGETETGAWSVKSYATGPAFSSISFEVQLKAALGAANVIFVEPGSTSHESECPGVVEKPTAAKGYLCVYVEEFDEMEPNSTLGPIADPSRGLQTHGAGTTGALIWLKPESAEPALAYGTWAVTGS